MCYRVCTRVKKKTIWYINWMSSWEWNEHKWSNNHLRQIIPVFDILYKFSPNIAKWLCINFAQAKCDFSVDRFQQVVRGNIISFDFFEYRAPLCWCGQQDLQRRHFEVIRVVKVSQPFFIVWIWDLCLECILQVFSIHLWQISVHFELTQNRH